MDVHTVDHWSAVPENESDLLRIIKSTSFWNFLELLGSVASLKLTLEIIALEWLLPILYSCNLWGKRTFKIVRLTQWRDR